MRSAVQRACLLVALTLLCAPASEADVIHLKNGRTIEGLIEGETEPYVTVSVGVGVIKLRKAQIAFIERADAEQQERIKDDWQSQYFLHEKFTPKGLEDLAQSFRGIETARQNAFRGIDRLAKLDTERLALIHELEQIREQSVAVARQLATTSLKMEPKKYNELITRNNALVSQGTIKNDRLTKARDEAGAIRASVSSYLAGLPAFAQRLKQAKRDYEDTPEKESNAIVFFGEIEKRMEMYASEIQSIDIPFEGKDGHLLVVARLNDKEDARLMVDTGASVVSFSKDMAARLELEPDSTNMVEVTLADGSKTKARPIVLDSVRVGDAQVNQVQALVLETGTTDGVDGLLGMSFLREFIVRMDAANGKLILQKLELK